MHAGSQRQPSLLQRCLVVCLLVGLTSCSSQQDFCNLDTCMWPRLAKPLGKAQARLWRCVGCFVAPQHAKACWHCC